MRPDQLAGRLLAIKEFISTSVAICALKFATAEHCVQAILAMEWAQFDLDGEIPHTPCAQSFGSYAEPKKKIPRPRRISCRYLPKRLPSFVSGTP
jgi:hypothetical protein